MHSREGSSSVFSVGYNPKLKSPSKLGSHTQPPRQKINRLLAGVVHGLDGCFSDSPTGSSDRAGELTFVDMDTFLATF